jgi:hypothetical protein
MAFSVETSKGVIDEDGRVEFKKASLLDVAMTG